MTLLSFIFCGLLHLPCTGERSYIPIVLGFLGLALLLFIIMMVLRRKNRG